MVVARSLMTIMAMLAVALSPAEGSPRRSSVAKAQFKRAHPCPGNGSTKGACPGFIIDHRQALCVGGSDTPENMRWMTTQAAKAKDKWECKSGWKKRLAECEAFGCFVGD